MRSSGLLAKTGPAPGPPLPPSPWQATHFSAKTRAPWAGVPLPGGKPVPSGMMAISHALMSASEIGFPSPGVSAAAAPEPNVSATPSANSGLSVDMFDLPGVADAPAGDAVVVLVGESQRVGRRRGLAPRGDELGPGRLEVAGLVPGAALQDHGLAIPAPGHTE